MLGTFAILCERSNRGITSKTYSEHKKLKNLIKSRRNITGIYTAHFGYHLTLRGLKIYDFNLGQSSLLSRERHVDHGLRNIFLLPTEWMGAIRLWGIVLI